MEISDILSVIAIIASFFSVVFQIISSKKINTINLNNKYYEKLFDEILLYRIPKDREYLVHIVDHLEGTDHLQKTMVDLRKKALFFKYQNAEFYSSLREMCMEIEDSLIENEEEISNSEYEKFNNELDKKIEDLYTLISKNSVN